MMSKAGRVAGEYIGGSASSKSVKLSSYKHATNLDTESPGDKMVHTGLLVITD